MQCLVRADLTRLFRVDRLIASETAPPCIVWLGEKWFWDTMVDAHAGKRGRERALKAYAKVRVK